MMVSSVCNVFKVRLRVWILFLCLSVFLQGLFNEAYTNDTNTSLIVKFGSDSYRAGEKLYGRCKACHAFEYNRVGPKHCGLNGRRAGSLDNYRFSEAMKQSGIVWGEESLDNFLKSPTKIIPGTSMGYAGIKSDAERRLLVAYILRESSSQERCADE